MSATTLMLGVVACGKNGADDPTPDKPDPKPTPGTETVINGTSIESTNTLVGLITDSKTGKGIAGVPVTDGYSFTTTDANGVYQFKANRYCRNVYYTLPSEYKVALDKETKLPLFYSTSTISYNRQNRNDFVLEPEVQRLRMLR